MPKGRSASALCCYNTLTGVPCRCIPKNLGCNAEHSGYSASIWGALPSIWGIQCKHLVYSVNKRTKGRLSCDQDWIRITIHRGTAVLNYMVCTFSLGMLIMVHARKARLVGTLPGSSNKKLPRPWRRTAGGDRAGAPQEKKRKVCASHKAACVRTCFKDRH
eukprot:1151484-Pelagomonas_calceolata.AAC.7